MSDLTKLLEPHIEDRSRLLLSICDAIEELLGYPAIEKIDDPDVRFELYSCVKRGMSVTQTDIEECAARNVELRDICNSVRDGCGLGPVDLHGRPVTLATATPDDDEAADECPF
jgi:hypothetical protein